MSKIKINIEDNSRFADIALLVDKREYQKLIKDLHTNIGITVSMSITDFLKHPILLSWQSKERDKSLAEKERLEAQQWSNENNETIQYIDKEMNNYIQKENYFLEKTITFILDKFNKSLNFRQIVLKTITKNSIEEEDYLPNIVRIGVSNIHRDRDWYWLNRRYKNSLGYKKLAKKLGENYKTVESAIRAYAVKLGVEERNSNITTQLAGIFKAFSDFRLVAQIKGEIEKVNQSL